MTDALRDLTSEETDKRVSKRDAILQEGAALLNTQGAGGIKLEELARTAGLSRNALYYYVKDRTDLVRQCYLRACDQIEHDLFVVQSEYADPQAQIEAFISRSLNPSRQQNAILANIDVLEPPYRDEVQARYDAHVQTLMDMIAAGQNTGQFKTVDPQITANVLLGMLNWTGLWAVNWSDRDEGLGSKLESSIEAIKTALFEGVATSDRPPFKNAIAYETLTHIDINAFNRSDARMLRQTQLLETASLLFNRRGLDGTRIDQIGDAIGASKSAVYRQFPDKQALINSCYERALDLYEAIWRVAEDAAATPREVLLTTLHLNCQAQASTKPPLIFQPGASQSSKQFIDRANLLGRRSLVHVRAAHQDGAIRFQSRELSDVTAGAFFWIQKWRESRPDLSSFEIADEITGIIMTGISSTDQ